jgi:hypothetical protein
LKISRHIHYSMLKKFTLVALAGYEATLFVRS